GSDQVCIDCGERIDVTEGNAAVNRFIIRAGQDPVGTIGAGNTVRPTGGIHGAQAGKGDVVAGCRVIAIDNKAV
ncbi:hypothetical protein, partial [Microbulbifer okhotskensis]|uniref:hypothetical protein n=1 Tax=Microbulbifer okhotskensis TaxID=2926617 RepID=UPI00207D5CA7